MKRASKPQRDLRVVVVGAGMSGILCGIRLQQEGITNFTLYEKGDRVGGTWHENSYPGLSCASGCSNNTNLSGGSSMAKFA